MMKISLFPRYEAGIDSGVMKIVVGSWYLYALVATASYAGEIRSFFINPGVTPALGYKLILPSPKCIYNIQMFRQSEGGG